MNPCLVALGANLGDRAAVLERAIDSLGRHPAVRIVRRSRWFHTEPIGGPPGQQGFINGAIRLKTSLVPEELLAVLRRIETDLGRKRRERWAARTIDLDLLLYGQVVLKTPTLQIPHPRMAFRRFVLEPAAAVAPDMRHPVVGWTIAQLLDHLNRAANYVALTGPPGIGKGKLARRVATATGMRLIRDVTEEGSPSPRRRKTDAPDTHRDRELLERRCQLVERGAWDDAAKEAISEFWVGQSMAYRRAGDGGGGDELEDAWRRVRAHVVAPKLLVLLHAPTGWLLERYGRAVEPAGQADRQWLGRLQSELRNVAFGCRQGPIFELDASEPDWAAAELTAAVEAMR